MIALLVRLAAAIGAYGSLAALAVSFGENDASISNIQWGLILAAAILMVFTLGSEIAAYIGSRPWIKPPQKVPAFLRDWIRGGGRVAIFSRNLSWVDNGIRRLLEDKSSRGELVLVIPREIELSSSLERLGAEVVQYPELGYTIRSRFTIINLGRADEAVAIGYRLPNGKHRIDRFMAGDPSFHLAQDLIELIRRWKQTQERNR